MRKDCLLGVVAILATACLPGSAAAQVTFNKDVLPIVQQHCQMCHRPGEVAPFSLLTFNDARPWARAIKTAVLTQQMPPWQVEPQYDHKFSNAARLAQAERDILPHGPMAARWKAIRKTSRRRPPSPMVGISSPT